MRVIPEITACRKAVRAAQHAGKCVGLVPTMGALHEGHLSLVRASRSRCAVTAVTIFVNPTQFGPGEDFGNYPRLLEADLRLCENAGADLVFTPAVDAMYPGDDLTTVHVDKLTGGLCGAHRSGHFDGVTTVVMKLFHILPVDVAFFGEKDYQQLLVIKKMVRDLNMPLDIVACPTVREADGLALSSRNAYLAPDERRQAQSLNRALLAAQEQLAAGEYRAAALADRIRRTIEDAGPAEIDYIEIVDPNDLTPLTEVENQARICLAVRIGKCRLIDNIGVSRRQDERNRKDTCTPT